MICWYCHWGWPKAVADIYKRALDSLNGVDNPLLFGPAHIVWEDENFHSAEWCLEHFDEFKRDYSDRELMVVKNSLVELAAIPIKDRCVEPEDYNNEHPELFPPVAGVEMVKVR